MDESDAVSLPSPKDQLSKVVISNQLCLTAGALFKFEDICIQQQSFPQIGGCLTRTRTAVVAGKKFCRAAR